MPQVANRVDILAAAWSNDAFRRVVLTGAYEQVVVMTIPPGGDIGEEVHVSTDQVLAFVDGHGESVEIIKRGRRFARLIPASAEAASNKPVKIDFTRQLRAVWGKKVFSEAEVQAMRDVELGSQS